MKTSKGKVLKFNLPHTSERSARKSVVRDLLVMLIFTLFLVGTGNAFAATYYVSPTGSDSSSGSSSTPFKTIQKAANIVNPGDTVIVRDGTYTDTDSNNRIVNVTRGGTSSAWVTFKAENKWGAVLDGQSNKTDYGFVIYDSVQYVKIQDFEIKGVNNGAIFSNPLTAATATGFIEVYRNKIHDVSRRLIYCDGTEQIGRAAIYGNKYSHDWAIDSNIAWNIGRLQGGCTVGNADYAHDHFVYIGIGTSTSDRTYNWDIINNIVYEGDTNFSGFFVAIGTYGENINIVNNTVKGHNANSTTYGVIYMNPGLVNLNVENNIFYGTPVGFLQNQYAKTDTGVTIYNNLTTAPNVFGYTVYSSSSLSATLSMSGNILSKDPLFVSLSTSDYHLQSTSPAINKGAYITGYTYDADGNPIVGAPDIGAYEYEGTSATTDTTAPSVPTGLKATVISTSQINLAWTASTDTSGVAGYRVYKNGSLVATVLTTSYSDKGLAASTTYSYTISAYDAAGNISAKSASVSATTMTSTDTQAPTVPAGLTATAASSSQINLTWTASTDNIGVTGYKVYRNGTQIATATTTSYSNTGLAASTSYTYTVSAYDAAGNESAQTASVSATTPSVTVIVNNGSTGTSYTGTWSISGGAYPYGSNSLWSHNGATYTWKASLPKSGTYKVYMWWTVYSDRATSVPVTVSYNGGSQSGYVNQQINGGKWNYLGTFSFDASTGGTVKLSAPGASPLTYCADAVMFVSSP